MVITIDGTPIKSPHDYKVSIYRLSKSGRLSSGLMVMDIVAKKRRLDLKWLSIKGSDLNNLITLLDANTFYTVSYPDPVNPTGQSTMTAYVGDISQVLFYSDNNRVWKDVSIALIER
jgi:hypothetical protein